MIAFQVTERSEGNRKVAGEGRNGVASGSPTEEGQGTTPRRRLGLQPILNYVRCADFAKIC